MDKQQILAFIEGQLATGKISKEDLLHMSGGVASSELGGVKMSDETHKEDSSKKLINVFYAIGAIIILGGIAILIGENWEAIGFVGRILVTAGISLIAYIYALFLAKPDQKVLSQVMFVISAALAPLGSYVLLSEANISFDLVPQTFTALSLCVIFGYALWSTRKNILTLVTIGFGTWAYFSFLLNVFSYDYAGDLLQWSAMFLGFAYILIAYGYSSASVAVDKSDAKEKRAMANVLYSLGTLAVLGAGISIGGAFDIFFIALIFAAFYGSVYLKSRSMLIFGALFLMAHIVKITSKYFVDSIGWPVALIAVGCLVIGVGYMTFVLNKRYISQK